MSGGELLRMARGAAGLSQDDVAARAGTSRPTLSAYEHGRKSPTLATAARVLRETGFELALAPILRFSTIPVAHGRSACVPDRLPGRLPVAHALGDVVLPTRLNWSQSGRRYRLRDRRERARVYEVVLREGEPGDILTLVDGALLVDLWDELVLPAMVRKAWEPLITAEFEGNTPRSVGA